MRIKKDPVTKNEYISAGGVWVRNFAKNCVSPVNISHEMFTGDYAVLVENEENNRVLQTANISDENLKFSKAIIISDGFDFENRHKIISSLPPDVYVIAVNKALAKWQLMSSHRRAINLFVVNNPYVECMGCIPKNNYYPTCIASIRTYPPFIKKYKGSIYCYNPTPTRTFGIERNPIYFIDDYRNPICAAVGLCYQFGVSKLMMMCCDDSFADFRENCVKLENGLNTYNQHLKVNSILDANFFWYKRHREDDVDISDYSSGPKYKNATCISNDEECVRFFD